MAKLSYTTQATPKVTDDGRTLTPINVCQGGTASCLTARMYKDGWTNYYSLGHYPSTAVLIEYGSPIKF